MIRYRSFVKVAEMKSIALAAGVLGYSRSKLNRIVEAFEDELGLRLLERRGDAVELTENGKMVLPYCQQLVETEDRLAYEVRSIQSQTGDVIRIGTPNSMLVGFVTKLIADFTREREELNLSIHEDSLASVSRQLLDGGVDIAFLTEEFAADATFYPLFDDEICLAVSENNELAKNDVLMAQDLRDVPIIYSPPGWDDITRIVISRLPFKPNIKYYSASDYAALAMVKSNLGVYVISDLQRPILPSGVVVRSFQQHYNRTVGIAVNSMASLTPNQQAFVEMSIEAFKK